MFANSHSTHNTTMKLHIDRASVERPSESEPVVRHIRQYLNQFRHEGGSETHMISDDDKFAKCKGGSIATR